jgi:predicted extracellular nuclease
VRHPRILPMIIASTLAATVLLPGVAHAADDPLSVGAVQGSTTVNPRTQRSPLAPAAGNGTSSTKYNVRGVVTQLALSRTATGVDNYGFFLQSRKGTEDGDPTTSDGVFVYMSTFKDLQGGYVPAVGDEIVISARVSEYFNLTELSGASLVAKLADHVPLSEVQIDDATPPADTAAADLFWERHEGMQLRVRAGSGLVSGTKVYSGTDDAEVWAIDRDDPLMKRADPYARRVFRDAHPLDDQPGLVDNGNGNRILMGPMGVKATAGDGTTVLPAGRTFDTVTDDAVGGVYYAFSKYSVQPASIAFTPGADPSKNNPPQAADRRREVAIATFNVENLYDFRDDPFDGCDFVGNAGCPGVSPPFDYVPASAAEYNARLAKLAKQIVRDLHGPDLILAQEAEDQDICTVSGGALSCGDTNNADGRPDTLQELALAVRAAGGPAYDAAFDRSGVDARGITAAFLYRTDRLSLAPASADDPVLGSAPQVTYRGAALPANTEVSNPKTLNAVLPADVDRSTGVDGSNVFTRAPQVGLFDVKAAPGSSEHYQIWALSNHYSSGPDTRVGQRREQAAYGAAIVTAIEATHPNARVVYGGDLNVFPRPDDPVPAHPGDQLGPLYAAGLHNLWDNLVADGPAAAYSYDFEGQGQTLDSLFVNNALYGDLIQMRAAHINADWTPGDPAAGARGTSDHDPQVARFQSRAALSAADASVVEGDSGTTSLIFPVTVSRPLSTPLTVCSTAFPVTAWPVVDFDPYLGCKSLPAGATSITFRVTVHGDGLREPDEKVSLSVAGLSPDVRLVRPNATGTIMNDD